MFRSVFESSAVRSAVPTVPTWSDSAVCSSCDVTCGASAVFGVSDSRVGLSGEPVRVFVFSNPYISVSLSVDFVSAPVGCDFGVVGSAVVRCVWQERKVDGVRRVMVARLSPGVGGRIEVSFDNGGFVSRLVSSAYGDCLSGRFTSKSAESLILLAYSVFLSKFRQSCEVVS